MSAASRLRRAALRELATALRFGIVGLVATAAHLGVAWLLLATTPLHPLAANTIAFMLAFGVSVSGHYRWTFRAPGQPVRAFLRFAVIALAGFAINTVVLTGLLQARLLPAPMAVAAALLIVPATTFVLSRYWGFREDGRARRADLPHDAPASARADRHRCSP